MSLKTTTLKELKSYVSGQIVELPPFAEGQPLVARVSRPSMLKMVSDGSFPNELLVKANEMFMQSETGYDVDDPGMMKDVLGVVEVMAEKALIEPTYEDIKKAGLSLTDDQLIFLFNYTQRGVKALESFRAGQEDRIGSANCEEV